MTHRRHPGRWSGPQADPDAESVANANQDFPDLTPVSEEPAQRVRDAWAALLPDYTEDDR